MTRQEYRQYKEEQYQKGKADRKARTDRIESEKLRSKLVLPPPRVPIHHKSRVKTTPLPTTSEPLPQEEFVTVPSFPSLPKKTRRKYDSSLPPKYKSYLMRANEKSFPLEFTVEEFELFTNQPCIYCGTGSTPVGIDRIDCSKGYTKANSVPCCWMCNSMKFTRSVEEFLSHVKKIYSLNSTVC